MQEVDRWFSKESLFQIAGLFVLNAQDSGGIYPLLAHLNHDCVPNISVCDTLSSQPDTQARNRTKDYRAPTQEQLPAELPLLLRPGQKATNVLNVLAKTTIQAGEELTLSYVNPEAPFEERQASLSEHYGFICACHLCESQREMGPELRKLMNGTTAQHHHHGPDCGHKH